MGIILIFHISTQLFTGNIYSQPRSYRIGTLYHVHTQHIASCSLTFSVAQSRLTEHEGSPVDGSLQAPLSMGFSRQQYWSGLPCPPPADLLSSGIKPRSPTLQADSLLSEPPGKPRNTGVGSLSFLQINFPTQESNQGLLHCKRILYQMS